MPNAQAPIKEPELGLVFIRAINSLSRAPTKGHCDYYSLENKWLIILPKKKLYPSRSLLRPQKKAAILAGIAAATAITASA
jgi:hypothetical protein